MARVSVGVMGALQPAGEPFRCSDQVEDRGRRASVGAFVDVRKMSAASLLRLLRLREDVAGALLVVEEGEGGEGLGAAERCEQVLDVGVGLAAAEAAAADGFGAGGFDGQAAEAGDDAAGGWRRAGRRSVATAIASSM